MRILRVREHRYEELSYWSVDEMTGITWKRIANFFGAHAKTDARAFAQTIQENS